MGVSLSDVQPLSSPAGQCPTPPIQITPDKLPSPPDQHSSAKSSPASVSDLLSPAISHADGLQCEYLEADSEVVKTEPSDITDGGQEESESIPKLAEWSDLKNFVTRLANDHNGERVYSCKICHHKGKKLLTHVESVHFPHSFQHICTLCDKECVTKQALAQHIYKMHKAEKSDEVKSPVTYEKLKESEHEEALGSCISNINKVENIEDVIKDKEVNSWSDLKQYVIKMPDEGEFKVQCTICQFKGRKMDNMTKHVECHHFRGALKHTCNLCKVEFDTKYALKYHTQTKHK